MQVHDIETNTKAKEEENGKCQYACCTVIILVALIIIIMAITGEFNKKN